jgi:hypothetical protein
MFYREEIRDLFSVSEDYYLAHCISADFCMGKGIVIEFNKRFDMKNILQTKYPNFVNDYHHHKWGGMALIEGRVINLITKERYWHKPTYQTMREALNVARLRLPSDCKKIAMPVIGCGLDRLQWDKVSEIIQDVFKNTDVEILVCKQ